MRLFILVELGSFAPQVGLEPTTLRLTAECSTDWAIEDYLYNKVMNLRRTRELAECSTDWAIEDY